MAALPRVPWTVLALAVLAPVGAPATAQDLVPVPELRSRVTDLTGTLDAAQAGALEDKLRDFESQTGSQIAVLLVPTARPEAIEQYAFRVAEAWQLGREGIDDGALLLVALDDREVRIEVGYGFEGVLTDATSNRIIDEAILPHFRTGDMYGGLAAGVDRMLLVARGDELPPPPPPATRVVDGPGLLPLVFALFVIAGVLTSILGRLLGAVATGGVAGTIALVFAGLQFALIAAFAGFVLALFVGGVPRRGWSSHNRYGGWGGGFGGGFGGGGGGFGGGGFSGGGGSFGGGGASGSW